MDLISLIKTAASTDYSALFLTPPVDEKSFSYLFVDPVEKITVKHYKSIDKKFNEIKKLLNDGFSSFILIDYEAGYLFEPTLHKFLPENKNLISFFFCNPDDVIKYKSSNLIFPDKIIDDFKINKFKLNVSKKDFKNNILKIKNYIAEGDTYQVNYTLKGKFDFSGDVSALFMRLLYSQTAPYTAFVNNKKEYLLSLSPELFFNISGRNIYTKPMKGTSKRGLGLLNDNMAGFELPANEKNKAENVMIVDLLRNDLGKISKFGSVNVNQLFGIEKYESLFQMVSSISSELKNQIQVTDVIKNIFPCGSITGAPKIRTMEIINEIEKEYRGIYTGSIGFIHKKKKVFNVAIRTAVINRETKKGEIGLGSGIVWDSIADAEYNETVLKSNFLRKPEKEFELIESMLIENGKILLLEDHLRRLKMSADYFLFRCDLTGVREIISREIKSVEKYSTAKLRLTLGKWGNVKCQTTLISPEDTEIKIVISKKRISTQNKFQYFKTSRRKIYDSELALNMKRGFFDVIFFNERNELAEGCRTNIFIRNGNSVFTPPVNSGILPGIARRNFLYNDAAEKILYFEDMMNADEIILTNAVRGRIKVNDLYLNEHEFRKMD